MVVARVAVPVDIGVVVALVIADVIAPYASLCCCCRSCLSFKKTL